MPVEKLVESEVVLAIIGNIGSDAGYWVLTPHGPVHVGGWGEREMTEFGVAARAIASGIALKESELGKNLTHSVTPFLHSEVTKLAQTIQTHMGGTASGAAAPVVVLVLNSAG